MLLVCLWPECTCVGRLGQAASFRCMLAEHTLSCDACKKGSRFRSVCLQPAAFHCALQTRAELTRSARGFPPGRFLACPSKGLQNRA